LPTSSSGQLIVGHNDLRPISQTYIIFADTAPDTVLNEHHSTIELLADLAKSSATKEIVVFNYGEA
jgi:hypothetical protein